MKITEGYLAGLTCDDGRIDWYHPLEGDKTVQYRLSEARPTRTGLHAKIGIGFVGNGGLLAWDNLNITKEDQRSRLARSAHGQLSEVERGMYPANSLKHHLNALCLWADRNWIKHSGEPLIDISKYSARADERARIHPLIPNRQSTVFFGRAGQGKTLLVANYLAVLAASGIEENGIIPRKSNVLILDYEAGEDETESRISQLSHGMGIDKPSIYYRKCIQPIDTDIDAIKEHSKAVKADLIIVDSAAPACGGSPDDAEAVNRFFLSAGSLGVSLVVIAHVTNSDSKRPFGSVFWGNLPRRLYRVSSSENKEGISVGIRNTKSNWGRRIKPINLRFIFEKDRIVVEPGSAQDLPDTDVDRDLVDRINDLLEESGTMSATDIAEELDAKRDSVRKTLNRNLDKFSHVGKDWKLQ